jgi:hypothetical protein
VLLLQGTTPLLDGKRIAILFGKAVKEIYPNTSKVDLLQYSAHFLRVWACVLLDKAGMSPEFIVYCLCWMGNSFRMYLWDTGIIQDTHGVALWAASQEVIDLISGSSANIPNLAGLSIVELDNTMGNYIDEMDQSMFPTQKYIKSNLKSLLRALTLDIFTLLFIIHYTYIKQQTQPFRVHYSSSSFPTTLTSLVSPYQPIFNG